ncbi:MAG TPA: PhzF family phenazine biosynthesis protein [Polyangiaceae bacterium]|nr:PhzF family phenazine biosynthesis protein [Polyangiaceae bacterium]
MRSLPYRLVDVFTARPFAGNALCVFTAADELDASTMQLLAREMNLSESAFVLRPTAPGADAALRIFTPTMELPFAGHPTLGAAFVLAEAVLAARAPQSGPVLRLQTARGIVQVQFSPPPSASGQGPHFAWMTQPLPEISTYPAAPRLLAALGVASSCSPVELYDNGPHYVMVELETAADVARLRPHLAELEALGSIAVTVTARQGNGWKTRVFAPGEGIPEDPATGAAAGPTAWHLARHGRIAYGDTILIEQGIEIGRPSTLYARVSGGPTRLERVEVGGQAVLIGRGELTLP